MNVITIPVLTTVRGVRLSKSHIVIALQNSVRVYRFKAKPELWGVYQTADNPLGLCCLTEKTLAFPGRTPGQLQLVDLVAETVSIIPAHGSSLRAINISRDGEILATASDTVSHVFHINFSKLNTIRVLWYESSQPATVLA